LAAQVQLDPVALAEAAARRAAEKRAAAERERERRREENRRKYPGIYALIEAGRQAGIPMRVTVLGEQGRPFDDRVACRDCAHFGVLRRTINFDGRRVRREIQGCVLEDAGKEPYRKRRCGNYKNLSGGQSR